MIETQRTEVRQADLRTASTERAGRSLRLAASGNPTAVLVEGAPGSGKTQLAASVAREARRQSFRVAELDARWAGVPFYAINQLTRQLGFEAAGERAGLDLLHALRLTCQQVGTGYAGVALIVDNADQLPAEDLATLYDVMISPPIDGFFALLTAGGAEGQHMSSLDFARAAGARRLRTERVVLEPLTLEDVAEAAERYLPVQASFRFVQSVYDLAAGNARYLFALLDVVAQLPADERLRVTTGSDPIDQIHVPVALADELLGPFEQLGATAQLIAQALAVLRQPSESKEIAALLQISSDDVEDMLIPLEARGLTRSTALADDRLLFEFTVPLTAAVARGLLPPLLRRKLNRSAALLKEEAGLLESDQALAFNCLEGVVPFTRERVERSIAVAERLVSRSRYHVARRILEDVLRRVGSETPGDVRIRALTALAETLSRSGAAADANAALDAALQIGRIAGDAPEPLVRKARDAVALGRSELAAEILEGVLTREDLTRRTRLRAMTDLSRLLLGRLDEERGRDLAEIAYDRAMNVEDWRIAIEADIAIHMSHFYSGRPRLALAHCRRALINAHRGNAGEAMLARTISGVGHALLDSSTLERGLHWIRRAHLTAELAEDLATASWTSQLAADGSLENGDWIGAAQWADTAVRLDASLHRERSLVHSQALDARLRSARGEVDQTWADPAQFPDYANIQDSQAAWLPVFVAHFEHAMLRGNVADAAELIDRTAAELRGRSMGTRALVVDVLPRVAESARQMGDYVRLRAASDELGALAEELGPELPVAIPAHLVTQAYMAELQGDSPRVGATSLEAAACFQRLGYHWRAALCYQLAGEAAVQLNEPRGAEYLMRAYRFYDSVGARDRLENVQRELRAIGTSPPRERQPKSILTARQAEIAGHAADGETDGEIALRLSISRRTVTTHMHNILGRLGLDSRQQLVEWFDDHTEMQPGLRLEASPPLPRRPAG